MRKSWILVCFANFFIASLMGLLLRWMYVSPIEGVNFQFLMHGHSHVAMLGWVFLMLYCLIFYSFIPKKEQEKPVYNRLFWVTEIAVLGMMIDFPAQGYAFVSILFSTLHIFCSYYFCRLIWKDAKPATFHENRMLKTALFFMVFSTLGVWCLGPAVGLLGKASAFYQIAIQFFLHFQFNGWFLFAVLALFFKQSKITMDEKKFGIVYNMFVIATVLTLALPVSWYLSNSIFYWINAVGVVLQFVSALLFVQLIKPQLKTFFSTLSTLEKTTYGFAMFSLALKIIIQLVVLVPELAQVSHQIRNFVIGYIHLTMLGIITGFLFGLAFQNNFLNSKKVIQKWGTILFLVGFVTTEILLFLQGIWLFLDKGSVPNYYLNLFLSSIFLPVGLLMLTIGVFQSKINSAKFLTI
ncbi:hypothetical protein [Flavobacterium gilvum]|uniref:Uncharacterized protein n=1 Tax=Flavobacterium gilvum TaxID=1492737 RepID=A0AAC9I5U3_9FLAO|nr:hypothetical protein [Flavobacterium gilvum]AOW09423.1 hypothetical protein EM308_07850 [Flavobacterium gilvum]KFC60511.1 membrane protein [Flavobacterium gilvum]